MADVDAAFVGYFVLTAPSTSFVFLNASSFGIFLKYMLLRYASAPRNDPPVLGLSL